MIGQNQSFKKVFVTNLNTIGTDGVKPVTLADEVIAIVDAATNLVESTPTVTNNPRIYIQQGETSNGLENVGVVSYGNALPNKTMEIVRGKVFHWSGKKAVTGQNEKWVITDNGGKCDDTRHLYIHMSGALIEQFAGLRGHMVHLEAQGPCCDTCDSDACETVVSCSWLEQFQKQINESQLPGGIKLSDVLQVNIIPIGSDTGEVDEEENPILTTTCSMEIVPALTNVETNECYWDTFPFFAEPIFLKISTYDPDFHNYSCEDDQNFTITQTQTALVPTGIGDYVKRQEVRSKMRDHKYRADDPAVRFAEGVKYFADVTKTYDVVTLGFYHEYKSGGPISNSNVYRNDYMVDIYFETGEATAFLAAMNPWVTASNPELSAVSL